MLHPSFRLIAPLAVFAVVTAVPAAAKDKAPPPLPAQIQELYACRDIGDAAARLACFDREVGELSAADQAREITFTDRETAKRRGAGCSVFPFPSSAEFSVAMRTRSGKSKRRSVRRASTGRANIRW